MTTTTLPREARDVIARLAAVPSTDMLAFTAGLRELRGLLGCDQAVAAGLVRAAYDEEQAS